MDKYMNIALKEAEKSLKSADVPVGAVIVENGKIIAKAHNKKEKKHSSIEHAELIAIRKACKKKKSWRLTNCILYVTLEPCMMCWSAINQSRISKTVYALSQQKKDILDYTEKQHGQGEEKSQKMLNEFFITKRK